MLSHVEVQFCSQSSRVFYFWSASCEPFRWQEEKQTWTFPSCLDSKWDTYNTKQKGTLRVLSYIYYKTKIKTIIWKLRIIWNICLSLSQTVTWPSSTNSFTAWSTLHAKWLALKGQPERLSSVRCISQTGLQKRSYFTVLLLFGRKKK